MFMILEVIISNGNINDFSAAMLMAMLRKTGRSRFMISHNYLLAFRNCTIFCSGLRHPKVLCEKFFIVMTIASDGKE